MIDRSRQIGMFGRYDLPVVNIAAEAECADFVTPAKAAGIPPFARMLHAVAQASLDVPQFRLRLLPDGTLLEVGTDLRVSYTVLGVEENLNFSSFDHRAHFPDFLAAYLADREAARAAFARGEADLRLSPLGEDRAWIFVTCLPWLRFTFIQHPIADATDCSIPGIAVGRYEVTADGRVRFPIAVQAHHGLVDGIHIARFIRRVEALLDQAADAPAQPAEPVL